MIKNKSTATGIEFATNTQKISPFSKNAFSVLILNTLKIIYHDYFPPGSNNTSV